MAAVKYAPPAIPPRKKYQTIIISHPGVLSIGAPLPAVTKPHQRAQPDDERRADREERVHDDVALRKLWAVRQVVRRRPREKEEERVQPTEEPLGIRAVELRVLEAHRLERLHAVRRLPDQLLPEPVLERDGRARLGARGPEPVVDPGGSGRAPPHPPRLF